MVTTINRAKQPSPQSINMTTQQYLWLGTDTTPNTYIYVDHHNVQTYTQLASLVCRLQNKVTLRHMTLLAQPNTMTSSACTLAHIDRL